MDSASPTGVILVIQLLPSRVPRTILGTIKTELSALSGENVADPKATSPVH